MKSKSKWVMDSQSIIALFDTAGIEGITNIRPLGNGEYNSIFSGISSGKEYVIKIAPKGNCHTLTYENDMIKQEVYFYSLIHDKTNIKVPDIYYSDFTCKQTQSSFFIMEKLMGKQINQTQLTTTEKATVQLKIAEMVAQMHLIKNDKFGYRQNTLYDNWYLAITSMVENLINDCQRLKRDTRNGKKLLEYIKQNEKILTTVDSNMVNFDIWPPNIFCQKENGNIKLAWIDLERCFFGDRIADFVCLDFMNMSLDKKKESIDAYNKISDSPLIITDNERIRFAIMLGYLGLIMEVEKYARYNIFHFGWWRNVLACTLIFKTSFTQLAKLSIRYKK